MCNYLHLRESRQLHTYAAHEFLQSAPRQSWAMGELGEKKTFSLTLSLVVLMCRESPSINNKKLLPESKSQGPD